MGYCFHHCHYCFKQLGENEECDCGYENTIIPAGTLPAGATLDNGRYIIGGVLGKGGFGITYKGFDTNFGSVVAIKEYYPDEFVTRGDEHSRMIVKCRRNPELYNKFLEKFVKEALILKGLSGIPGIVKVENLIRNENNTSYIIMEYVDGKSLKKIIREKGGKMSWDELHPLMEPFLDSIQQIHEKGIIHRDIAPDNILVDNSGRPVLIDFGIARIGEASSGSVPAGKLGFAPIEQVVGADSQDCRTDVHALGATYYYALTGKTPQNAKNRVGRDEVQPVCQLEPEVPVYVSDAVMKAMAPSIDYRWNSVAEFRDALNTPPAPPSKTFIQRLLDLFRGNK